MLQIVGSWQEVLCGQLEAGSAYNSQRQAMEIERAPSHKGGRKVVQSGYRPTLTGRRRLIKRE